MSRSGCGRKERRRAGAELPPGLDVAETLFEFIEDVLFCIKDRERRYVAVNDAFVRRTGLRSRADILGRTAREVFPEILASGYEQQDEEIFTNGASVRNRLEMITQPNGETGWFVSQKIAVKSDGGRVVAIAGISRDLRLPAEKGGALGPMAEALRVLHRDCAEPIRIRSLAEKAGLSWSQFQRRMRAVTGLTPRQLLTKSRVEMAAERLRGTERPISEIASSCGFYDQAALCNQFRAATGLTPGAYRKAARGERR